MIEMTYCAPMRIPGALRVAVRRVKQALRRDFPPGVVLAVRGLSGTTVGAVLAYHGYPVVYVRKPGTNPASHGHVLAEGPRTALTARVRYVIVDDFSSTGATMRAIEKAMPGRCLGAVLYAGDWSRHCLTLLYK